MVQITKTALALATLLQTTNAIKRIDDAACFADSELTFGQNQYFIFYTRDPGAIRPIPWCYAESGTKEYDVGDFINIVSYRAGNNAGRFEYEPGDGSMYKHEFSKQDDNTQDYYQLVYLTID